MDTREIKHRLRDERNYIVGYERWNIGAFNLESQKDYYMVSPHWEYSKDGITWTDKYINHRHKDASTGLKDKNGVEIYDGDIVQMADVMTGSVGLNPGFIFGEEDKVAIAWDNEIAAWSLEGKLDRTDRVEVAYRNQVIDLIHQGRCSVVGNVYHNSEILKN